jgi:hypothetical protein
MYAREVSWVEVFAVLLVCHLMGDFLLQTEWQALNKHGGLGRDPVKRRALLMHIATYAIPFLPAFVWIGHNKSTGAAFGVAAVTLLTHLVQDDGRLMMSYIHHVKKTDGEYGSPLIMAVDQSFHASFLFAAALLVST